MIFINATAATRNTVDTQRLIGNTPVDAANIFDVRSKKLLLEPLGIYSKNNHNYLEKL